MTPHLSTELKAISVDPNTDNDWLIETAIENGDYDLIDIFLKYGGETGIPALSNAISVGDYDTATILLTYEVDVNVRGIQTSASTPGDWNNKPVTLYNEAQTALEIAIEKGRSQLIEPLILAGADPYLLRQIGYQLHIDDKSGSAVKIVSTAVHDAIMNDRLNALKTMYKLGIALNKVCTPPTIKPLTLAISNGKWEIAKFLISIGETS